jgi:hypothetical protein
VTTRQEWAIALLDFGGWPLSAEKVIGIVAWGVAEGSEATWNPLDTTQSAPGASDYNSAGVKNYPSQTIGIEATYATLHNGDYPKILACLSDPSGSSALALAAAVGSEPWGTGNFSRVVEEVKADPERYFSQIVAGSGGGLPPDPTPGPGPEPPTSIGGLLAMLLADAQFAVRFLYRFCLYREADQAGYDQYVNQLTSGSKTLDQVMAELQDSPEGQAAITKQRTGLGL